MLGKYTTIWTLALAEQGSRDLSLVIIRCQLDRLVGGNKTEFCTYLPLTFSLSSGSIG